MLTNSKNYFVWITILLSVLILNYSSAHAATVYPTLSVSQSGSPAAAGSVINYQIIASDADTLATLGFKLYATVPNNTTVSSAQAGGGACSGGSWPCQPGQNITWNSTSNIYLSAGQSATYQFSVQVNNSPAPSDGTVIATNVTTNLVEGPTTGAQSVIRSTGGLNVLLSCPPNEVPSLGKLVCEISYSNSNSANITSQVTFSAPSGLSVLGATSGGSISGGTVTWNLGTLATQSSGQQLVTLQAASGLTSGTTLVSSAKIVDTSGVNLEAVATAPIIVASTNPLQIAVSATPDPVQAGQTVTYSITMSNTATTTTVGFLLRASVPNYTTVTVAQAGGGACSGGSWPCQPGQDILWNSPNPNAGSTTNISLAAGQSATYQFTASVNSTSPPANGSLLTTIATTSLGGSTVGQALVGAAGPSLALNAPEQVPASGNYTYTLTYGNSGSSTLNTELQMQIPVGTTFVSASPGSVVSNGVVSWDLSGLAPGQAASQQLTVQAPSATGTVVEASAQVINPSTQQSYSRATGKTTIASTNPLQIAITATPDPVQAGQTVTYSITLWNTANSATAGFLLRASVPNYTTVTVAQAGGGACSGGSWPCQPGQDILWNSPNPNTGSTTNISLAAGQSATYQFTASVNSTSPPANGSLLTTVATTSLSGSAESTVRVGTTSSVQGPTTSSSGDVPIPEWMLSVMAMIMILTQFWVMRKNPDQ